MSARILRREELDHLSEIFIITMVVIAWTLRIVHARKVRAKMRYTENAKRHSGLRKLTSIALTMFIVSMFLMFASIPTTTGHFDFISFAVTLLLLAFGALYVLARSKGAYELEPIPEDSHNSE